MEFIVYIVLVSAVSLGDIQGGVSQLQQLVDGGCVLWIVSYADTGRYDELTARDTEGFTHLIHAVLWRMLSQVTGLYPGR